MMNNACFVASTMMKMVDATEKAIEDIDPNDNAKHGGLVWDIGQESIQELGK